MNFTNTDCVARLDDWDIPKEFWDIQKILFPADLFWQVFHVTYQIKYKITKINKI